MLVFGHPRRHAFQFAVLELEDTASPANEDSAILQGYANYLFRGHDVIFLRHPNGLYLEFLGGLQVLENGSLSPDGNPRRGKTVGPFYPLYIVREARSNSGPIQIAQTREVGLYDLLVRAHEPRNG
jgi:hypothetical protein